MQKKNLQVAIVGASGAVGREMVDVLVRRLRNKIECKQGMKLIHTLRGIGYVLRVE